MRLKRFVNSLGCYSARIYRKNKKRRRKREDERRIIGQVSLCSLLGKDKL